MINMAKPFHYDITALIEQIKRRPCIWDKSLDTFKDRTEKQKAWDEICAGFEKDFHRKDKKEQRRMVELLAAKWQNVRDAFVKSIRKQSLHPHIRKYLYYEKLQFLMKVLQKDGIESKYLQGISDEGQTEEPDEASSRKKPRSQEDMNEEILKALRHSKSAPDEDEAFFISVTPAVRKMSGEDKLEFRMGVLQLIKKINNRGKDQPDSVSFFANSSSSHPSTSFDHYANPKLDSDGYEEDQHVVKCE